MAAIDTTQTPASQPARPPERPAGPLPEYRREPPPRERPLEHTESSSEPDPEPPVAARPAFAEKFVGNGGPLAPRAGGPSPDADLTRSADGPGAARCARARPCAPPPQAKSLFEKVDDVELDEDRT